MKRRVLLLQGSAFLGTLAVADASRATPYTLGVTREPVVGGPCEGCELVFEGMPRTLSSSARIAPVGEPGVPMIIEGMVRTRQGKAAPELVVYGYHTDNRGIYAPGATRHGRLRGWALTDSDGRYRFVTIRPVAYPGRKIPQHVHMHVIEPGKCTYYIDELRFEDDPQINDGNRRTDERGGRGLIMPTRRDGSWYATRDIVLGLNIPGYD